jgi:hypothetical protein
MSEPTRLGKLIADASRANHGRSMQAAADLATSRGAEISKSLISENARSVKTVTKTVIRGIAAGYEVPEEEVARAMLEDLGFSIADYSPGIEAAIRRDPDLSSEARAILLAAIGAARPSRSGSGVGTVAGDKSQDDSYVPGRWVAPRKKPGVLGHKDRDKRNNGRG